MAQNYQYFRQATNTVYGTGSHNIMPDRYRTNLYILGCNLEKVPYQATHSGISTKDGSIVQLSVKESGLAVGDACIIFQIHDSLMSIRDGSVDVFD